MSEFDTSWKVPKRMKLKIAVFYTPSYFAKDDRGNIAKAREILDRHNIELSVWPDSSGSKGVRNTIPWPGPIAHTKIAYEGLRGVVTIFMMNHGGISVSSLSSFAPVVFTQFDHPGYAIAPPWFKQGSHGCLVSPVGNADCADLLHELGHCAMSCSNSDHEDDRSNIMNVANGRSTLYRKQVEKFAKAPFAVQSG